MNLDAGVLLKPAQSGPSASEHLLGTVTQVSPLRVRLDGDSIALPYTPSLMTAAVLSVGDRVIGTLIGGRLCLLGGSTAAAQPASPFAVGMILDFGGDVAPFGFLLGGQDVSRATYAALFAVIGTKYGPGNGSTTFGLPKAGVARVSRDAAQSEFNTVGKTGGTKTHTLIVAEMPSHAHTELAITAYAGYGQNSPINGNAVHAQTSLFTGAAGGGGAHNNLQPYQVSNVIIKY